MTLPSGQRCTLSSLRTRSHSSLGACGSPGGGSQLEKRPFKSSDPAMGRYITRPGNNEGIAAAMAFHASVPFVLISL